MNGGSTAKNDHRRIYSLWYKHHIFYKVNAVEKSNETTVTSGGSTIIHVFIFR